MLSNLALARVDMLGLNGGGEKKPVIIIKIIDKLLESCWRPRQWPTRRLKGWRWRWKTGSEREEGGVGGTRRW